MPIYAYRCEACGFNKDVLQKLSDAPLNECPSCGKQTFSKTLTAPAFQLKGSGWYVTDFRDNGQGSKGADPAAADAAKPDTKPGDAAKTETKPAAESSPSAGASAGADKAGTAAPAASSASGSSLSSGSSGSGAEGSGSGRSSGSSGAASA